MKFSKGNGIKCSQDHCCLWYNEIPTNIDFNISNDGFGNVISLTAYGYGQTELRDEKSYGNGALFPYDLSKEQKEFLLMHLNDAPAKQSESNISTVNAKCPHCGKDITVAVTSDEYVKV